MSYNFSFVYIADSLPALLGGLVMTVQVSLLSIACAVVVGVFGAAIRVFDVPVLSQAVRFYVHMIRTTPILAQLYFIFYGLPSLGIPLSLYWSGVLCLVLWGGAYNIENVRGGFLAVSKGLRMAADALGLERAQYLRYVALPLGLRVSTPAILNTSVSVLKNSAYLQTIGLVELTFVAMERSAMDFRTLENFAAICVLYLALVWTLSYFVRRIENHLHKPFRDGR
ncbi:MAG: amino acid ABC transporter permease [Rhodospirillales bacterium]|nr:amino acid ABC transporter permease [Rhodospirillales bacterium]